MTQEKAPLRNHRKMKTDHQLNVYLVNGDDHADQWWSTNLNQNGNMPQYGIICVVGQKIRWHQIIHHQVCNPNHPCPQLNQINRSKKHLPKGEAWWHPNTEKVWVWLNGLRDAPMGDHNKIENKSSSRRVSPKWGQACNSMKICKSQSKRKYAPIWNQMYYRSKKKIEQHRITHNQMCNPNHPYP